MVTAEKMSSVCEELVLSFLRYNTAMLREVRARVRQMVQRASLNESCAEQRREIISRQRALEQAVDGVFELSGVHTPAQKEEWTQSSGADNLIILRAWYGEPRLDLQSNSEWETSSKKGKIVTNIVNRSLRADGALDFNPTKESTRTGP